MIRNSVKCIIKLLLIILLCGLIVYFWVNNKEATGSGIVSEMYNKLNTTKSEVEADVRWLCVEHGQGLSNSREYEHKLTVEIVGNKLTGNGITTFSQVNALMGYILASGEFKKNEKISNNNSYVWENGKKTDTPNVYGNSELQIIVWNRIKWFQVGNKVEGAPDGENLKIFKDIAIGNAINEGDYIIQYQR